MSQSAQSAALSPSGEEARIRVLFVDDDLNILKGFQRSLHDDLEVVTASGAVEGLRLLDKDGPFTVLVTDQNMPQVDGVTFLKKVAEHFPAITRIMLTGNIDQKAAERAVNIGKVFRFLTKPCNSADLLHAVRAAHADHKKRARHKLAEEENVSGIITLLTDMLAMGYPEPYRRSAVVRAWIDAALVPLGLNDPWALRTAALLWPLSHVVLPRDVVARRNSGEKLTSNDLAHLASAYMSVAKLLRNLPRFASVARLFEDCCRESSDVRRTVEAELLRLLVDLSFAVNPAKPEDIPAAIGEIGKGANPAIIAALPSILASSDAASSSAVRVLSAFELRPGDMLLTNLVDDEGRLLLASGRTVSDSIAAKIRQIHADGTISGRFRVVRA